MQTLHMSYAQTKCLQQHKSFVSGSVVSLCHVLVLKLATTFVTHATSLQLPPALQVQCQAGVAP